jgi:hypothetical protein
MENIIILSGLFYSTFSLLASAIYFNSKTPHTKSKRVLNHVLIWAIPFFWALYLKNSMEAATENPIINDSPSNATWKIWEDQYDIYFAESGFEGMYDRIDSE